MAPADKSPTAKPIRFGVALPASWSGHGAQLGGGGMNGSIPMLTGGAGRGHPSLLAEGFATYGSDSGHQMSGFGMPGGMGMGMRGAADGGAGPGAGMPGMPGRGQGMGMPGMPAGFESKADR